MLDKKTCEKVPFKLEYEGTTCSEPEQKLSQMSTGPEDLKTFLRTSYRKKDTGMWIKWRYSKSQIAKCSEGQVQWEAISSDECLEGASVAVLERMVGGGSSRGNVGDEVLVGAQARDNDELLQEECSCDIGRDWLFELLFGTCIMKNFRYIEGRRYGNHDI